MESSRPHIPPSRRFTLLDGMILVAALAAGLGLLRLTGPLSEWTDILGVLVAPEVWTGDWLQEIIPEFHLFAMPPAVTTSVAVLALRLRGPRPRWRRLARQPGLIAGLALVGAWAVASAFTVAHLAWTRSIPSRTGGTMWDEPSYWLQVFTEVGSTLGGFAVAVSWATLALGGRWRAEPTWVDRLGRLVGAGWVAMGLVAAYEMKDNFFQ